MALRRWRSSSASRALSIFCSRTSSLSAIAHDVITKPFSVADIRIAVADALAARKTA
jgi:CheY-like chemotaxis protein